MRDALREIASTSLRCPVNGRRKGIFIGASMAFDDHTLQTQQTCAIVAARIVSPDHWPQGKVQQG
jgi:hypothetical protein